MLRLYQLVGGDEYSYGDIIVGRRVAELEMHILLAQLIRNYKLEYRDEKPLEFTNKLLYVPARQMDLAFVDIQ